MVHTIAQENPSTVFATRDRIIEVAIRRFGHFGFDKTTMAEIAIDASISKQALWNYFSDKRLLITAVIEKVIGEYIATIEKEFAGSNNVPEALEKLLTARKQLHDKYSMLVAQLIDPQTLVWNKSLIEAKDNMKEKEVKLLRNLFMQGITSGELKPMDAEKAAVLILDVLTTMFIHAIDWSSIPDPNACEDLYQKQKDLLTIIFTGLKACPHDKNNYQD